MSLGQHSEVSKCTLLAGLLLLSVGLSGCGQGSQTTSNPPEETKSTADVKTLEDASQTGVDAASDQSATGTTLAGPPLPETPQPRTLAPDVHLIVRYVRPGVDAHQHYVRVEQTVAGPTVCSEESLLLELQNTDIALQWEPQDRLDVIGAYHAEEGGCRVVLSRPTHTIKTLPKTESPPPSSPELTPVTSDPSAAPTVRLLGTLSGVRDNVAFFIVDRVIEGEQFDCVQATVVGEHPELVEQAQYQVEGRYVADDGNCQLRLDDPLNGLILLALPPAIVPPKSPAGTPPGVEDTLPFFISAGVSYLDPLPIFSGSAGLRFAERLGGMVTAGFGTTTTEMMLPSGEPIDADVDVVLLSFSGLLSVQGPFYLGLSGGMLLLSGTYSLPYPVDGVTTFRTSIPLLGVVVGYDLGLFMVTLGAELALGGR